MVREAGGLVWARADGGCGDDGGGGEAAMQDGTAIDLRHGVLSW